MIEHLDRLSDILQLIFFLLKLSLAAPKIATWKIIFRSHNLSKSPPSLHIPKLLPSLLDLAPVNYILAWILKTAIYNSYSNSQGLDMRLLNEVVGTQHLKPPCNIFENICKQLDRFQTCDPPSEEPIWVTQKMWPPHGSTLLLPIDWNHNNFFRVPNEHSVPNKFNFNVSGDKRLFILKSVPWSHLNMIFTIWYDLWIRTQVFPHSNHSAHCFFFDNSYLNNSHRWRQSAHVARGRQQAAERAMELLLVV